MIEIERLARPEILAMTPYSSARTEGPQNAEVFLDANENPYPPFPGTGQSVGLNRYPEPQPQQLIERFSHIHEMPAEMLFVSRGADESIDLLVRAFCRAEHDAIVITPPAFVMYETAAAVQAARVVRVPLFISDTTSTFELDVPSIVRECENDTSIKLIFITSPNNPTANLMSRDGILEIADATMGNSLVIVDELYVDYSSQPSICKEINAHPNIVSLRSMSKEYSFAGERIGLTIAHPCVIQTLRRIMAPYSLTVSSIRNALVALSDEGLTYGRDNIARILQERRRVELALGQMTLATKVFPSDANFLLVVVNDAHTVSEALAQRGIKVRDRSTVVENSLRISIGTPEENDRLLSALEGLASHNA